MNLSLSLSWLIHELEQLYRQISLDHFHSRMSDYHKEKPQADTSGDDDIRASLSDYIDSVEVEEKRVAGSAMRPAREKYPGVDFRFMPGHEAEQQYSVYPFRKTKKQDASNPYSLSREQVNQLAKHFGSSRKGVISGPAIKEKLRKSIWEHINAAVRHAHKGDSRSAKINADIAENAFREVKHYMADDEYAELENKVRQRLESLKSASANTVIH